MIGLNKKIIPVFLLMVLLVCTPVVDAHQPRLVAYSDNSEYNPFIVEDPEVSKAYYGELKGNPEYYVIDIKQPSSIYFNVLIPDVSGEKKFVSAEVLDSSKQRILLLDGAGYNWTKFYEEFARDDYLKGPETTLNLTEGVYYVKVSNEGNYGKYILATGDIESFPPAEIIKTIFVVPVIKFDFFKKPFTLAVLIIAILPVIFGLFLLIKKIRK